MQITIYVCRGRMVWLDSVVSDSTRIASYFHTAIHTSQFALIDYTQTSNFVGELPEIPTETAVKNVNSMLIFSQKW